MKFKIKFLVVVIAAFVSCKNNNKAATKTEESETVKHSTEPVDSSQAKVSSPEVQDYKDRLHNIVERMNKGFANVQTTGNPEDDFSKLMITNQFAGIEMCELHLKAGSDTIMKALAKKKLAFLKKQEEIFHNYQFNSSTGYRPPVKKNVPRIKHLEIADASDKDAVFAQILSEYNQNTIDLAKSYLESGTNTSMKSAAQTIIQNFSRELQQMKQYITKYTSNN
jgi:uncharacterized protein (DUF305 family)